MTYRRLSVKFAVKGHPDPKTETVETVARKVEP